MGTCKHCREPVRARGLCNAHYKKLKRYGDPLAGRTVLANATRLERYLVKVGQRGPDECWPWMACRHPKNYGLFPDRSGGTGIAHRYGFGVLVRPLGPDEVVDHICHNNDPACPGGNTCEHRACQNPAHWQAVSGPENTARGKGLAPRNAAKTRCERGHEFTPGNIYWDKTGGRHCRACALANAERQREASRELRQLRYREARDAGMGPREATAASYRRAAE
jgi:hypothetical protein